MRKLQQTKLKNSTQQHQHLGTASPEKTQVREAASTQEVSLDRFIAMSSSPQCPHIHTLGLCTMYGQMRKIVCLLARVYIMSTISP